MSIIGPYLCSGLVIGFSGLLILQLNAKAQRQINEDNNFKLLDVLHHFTSGLKAFATEQQYVGMDEMR